MGERSSSCGVSREVAAGEVDTPGMDAAHEDGSSSSSSSS
jgi:hypothetical protein